MSSLLAQPATVKPVSFIEAPARSIAFVMGAADAAQGDLCVPETIFTHPDDKRDYAAGYESVTGPTLTTRQFLAPRMVAAGRIWEGEIVIATEDEVWSEQVENEMSVHDTAEGPITDAVIDKLQAQGERDEEAHLDYDAELEDLHEGMADEQFWASGSW